MSSLTEASYVGCRGTINISILPGSNTTASQTIIWRNIKQSPPKYIQLYLPWRLSRLASIFDNWGKLSVWFPFYFCLCKEGYWTKDSRPEPCSSLGIAVSARLFYFLIEGIWRATEYWTGNSNLQTRPFHLEWPGLYISEKSRNSKELKKYDYFEFMLLIEI